MNKHDALRIFGLGSEASLEDAKRAYREQVKLWHPDRYSDSAVLQSIALKNTQDANRAWACLRSQLPPKAPRLNTSTARTQARARVERKNRFSIKPAHKINIERMLRQGVLKLAPLVARIKHLPIGGIAEWLKEDPHRQYRPWYRYPHESGRDLKKGPSPSFDQALAKALRSRNDGELPASTHQKVRPQTKTPIQNPSSKKLDQQEREGINAINPVTRTGKS